MADNELMASHVTHDEHMAESRDGLVEEYADCEVSTTLIDLDADGGDARAAQHVTLKCYVRDCAYAAQSPTGLRIHLLRRHDIRQKSNLAVDTAVGGSDRSARFACAFDECAYAGDTFKGYCIHMRHKHGQRVTPDTRHVTRVAPKRGASHELFACTRADCTFAGKSRNALRMHLCNKHGIRVKSLDTIFDDTAEDNRKSSEEQTEYKQSKHVVVNEKQSESLKIKSELTPTSRDASVKAERKSSVVSYGCAVPDCDYGHRVLQSVRFHMLKRHHINYLSYGLPIVTLNADQHVARVPQQLFRCPVNDCKYIGQTVGALQTHANTRHAIKLEEKKEVVIRSENTINEKNSKRLFRCVANDCHYANSSFYDLLIHKQNAHKRHIHSSLKRKQFKVCHNDSKEGSNDNSGVNPFAISMKRNAVLSLRNNEVYRIKRKYTRHAKQESNELNRKSSSTQTVINRLNDTRRSETTERRTVFIQPYRPQVATGQLKSLSKSFKCQFPGCAYAGVSGEELKNHVRFAHKRNQNSDGSVNIYKCYFPNCAHVAYTAVILKQHIAEQHKRDVAVAKAAQQLYKCQFPNCRYVGSTSLKGLRIHFKRNHGKSVAKNARYRQKVNQPITAQTPTQTANSANVAPKITPFQRFIENRQKHLNEQRINYESSARKSTIFGHRNLMSFKCPQCLFSVDNLEDLRAHISARHPQDVRQTFVASRLQQ